MNDSRYHRFVMAQLARFMKLKFAARDRGDTRELKRLERRYDEIYRSTWRQS